MSSQSNNVDLDRQISEQDARLRSNPRDAVAYRERGFCQARKRDLDRALKDLNQAVLLDPKDPRAYSLRGWVLHALKEDRKAIADFEKAIELDPGHADLYRAQRDKIAGSESPARGGDPSSKRLDDGAPAQKGLRGFFKRLAQYYAEFLSTDFKKQRLPRRRLQNSDEQGRLVGVSLRKYPGFQQKLWQELGKPIGSGLSLNIPRGAWRSTLPKAVVDATASHIAAVTQQELNTIVDGILDRISKMPDRKGADPVVAFEQFLEGIRGAFARIVIGPLLDRMDGFFARTENKPVESLKELEDQLSSRLVHGIESSAGGAFSIFLVDGDAKPLESVLRDQVEVALVRSALEAFFAGFNAGDLYVEISDLVRSSRLIENADFYLHIGEVHHANQVFPAFYIPFAAERTENGFKISSDPRFYVNKRAMDYVAQEVGRAEGRPASASVLQNRIFYLAPEESAIALAQKLFDDMAAGFNLRADIDFSQPRDQSVSSMFVSANNRLSLSLFDRSDESTVNDYEALVTGIDAGGDVVEFFKSLIDDFLLSNPVSVRADVDRAWEEMPMQQRLVFDSPLPLVEEQRKILSALRHQDSQFIAVEGPPGTGKSHTITAVAFDLILAGKSLLVLSDKKEALDVVEGKLNQALAKVRPSQDFPNPILRLGKDSSNYAKLLKKSAVERLQVNQRVVRRERPKREKAIQEEREALAAGLEDANRAYAEIDLLEIAELERDVASLAREMPQARALLEDLQQGVLVDDFGMVADFLRSEPVLTGLLKQQGSEPRRLTEVAHLHRVLASSPIKAADLAPVSAFSLERLHALEAIIAELEAIRSAVFGYLFVGKKVNKAAAALQERCGLEYEKPHRALLKLKELSRNLRKLHQHLTTDKVERDFDAAVALVVSGLASRQSKFIPPHILEGARRLEQAVLQDATLLTMGRGRFYPAMIAGEDGPFALLARVAALRSRERAIADRFEKVPKVDYIGTKTKIESLNTQALAERIDDKFIDFYDNKRNDAMALGKIIREKQRFPVDKFADIQRAFPCVIAGLREYAEFIPLERGLFDLVIIDEASQVSIAQALPAIIRAKKVLVLGDRNQFGNVKTSTASREVNGVYMQDLMKVFAQEFAEASQSVKTKIDLFDIRSSVLDFMEPISNFSIQLKKHFRSYPEMISFSSKYFYSDNLQVMKIRGKPIEEVIEFDKVDHDGLIDKRNVNALEADRILKRITELANMEYPPTVGVITPHTEQQAFIANAVSDHHRSDELYDKLRLKIMTFDTCQGEEREIIFYSLVATDQKDRLAYVFPSKLGRDQSEEVDHSLRLQRLNVGLSRGQEKIIFIHSKELDNYASSLKVALLHYQKELDRAKSMPLEIDLDDASPMERKVLQWLGQVPIIRDLEDNCEVIAQFELGRYLKQLDPTYDHPEYRVDFLLRISQDHGQYQMVIEYDGFEFHFEQGVPSRLINETTWRTYLTPDDLEREKVLESFGVPMIRLNRFNLGKDPVATIDRMIRDRLDGLSNGRTPHEIVEKTADEAKEIEQGLKVGDYRRCKKCDRDLPLDMFRDPEAKSGLSRHCRDCKNSSGSTSYPSRRRYYRYRR